MSEKYVLVAVLQELRTQWMEDPKSSADKILVWYRECIRATATQCEP